MKPASLLGLVACGSLLFASSAAFEAPGDQAPKKKKPKTAVAAKAPKKVEAAEPAPEPVAPETKAADAKPAEVKPVPAPAATAAASSAPASADRASESRHGDEEESDKAFSVAPLMGFGSNHYGFAIGARAGYTFPAKVYVGGTLMYHFGSTYGYGGYLGSAGEYSTHVIYPAGEVGYDFHVGPVTIRPYAGVGIAFVSASTTINGVSAGGSDSSLLLYPGATAHWNIPRSNFFVGGDTRMLILTRGGDPSFALYATGGLKF